jgi:hypothetical protein
VSTAARKQVDLFSSSRCRICDASQLSGRRHCVNAAKLGSGLKLLPMHRFFMTAAIGTTLAISTSVRQAGSE